jgi:type I restriction enzyme S subunit
MAHGSTFKEIRAPLLKKLEFPLPPVSEQHKIAEILGSVDKVIEKTQAVIDQTEIIKKGLMQELLTRGIPGRHQKFKTTEIGEIPEEWEVKKIKDCVSINPDQLGISTDEEMIIKYLDISGIEKTGVIGEFKDYLFKEAPCRARRKVQKGDIIISTVRPYLRAFACLRNCPDNLIVSTGFAVLRSNKIEDIEFIYQNILYNKFVDSLIDKMTGSNYPAVSSGDIGEYKIAYPNNIKEKELISNILNVIDNNLKYETIIMEKIGILKSALMQVLLTGKVRVKI